MPPVGEKPASLFALGAGDVVPPISPPAQVPAVRHTTALVSGTAPLDTYQKAVVEFGRASGHVGQSGGMPVPVPSSWGYFFRFTGLLTSGAAATALGGTAVIAALTALEFSVVPTLICSGIGAVGSAIAGGLMADEGTFQRWGRQREARVREARSKNPLEGDRVAFLKKQFDNAQPVERALLGDLAAKWLEELDERRVIGKQSRDVLRAIVAEAKQLPSELKQASKRVTAVANTVFDSRGKTIDRIDAYRAKQILAACRALTDDEHACLGPRLRDLLFIGEKPRVAMDFEACQELLEGLHPRTS